MSGPSQPCECQPRIHPFLLETFQRAKHSPVLEDGKICTNCVYGNGTTPTSCVCENPPFSVSAKCALNVLGIPESRPYGTSVDVSDRYNEECGMGKECGAGEGICYRPCSELGAKSKHGGF